MELIVKGLILVKRIKNILYKAFIMNEMKLLFILLFVLTSFITLFSILEEKNTIVLSVLSSMIASIIIIILYSFLETKKKTIIDIYNEFGLYDIYEKKTEATDEFSEKILKAKNRIWAIGMTNKAFVKQQKVNLNSILKKELDLRATCKFNHNKIANFLI